MNTAILIPARYNSSRFPGKALTPLNGVPMVRRVYERCRATGFDTYVLTDDERIAALFEDGVAVMTKDSHENGTSRCMEVIMQRFKYRRFINVQGDIPDITADIIHKINEAIMKYTVVTAYTKMDPQDQQDPNVVKIIHNTRRAHWFLRAPLSYGDRHLGVYGYDATAKLLWSRYATPLEQTEKLEQLRWLDTGTDVGVVEVEFDGVEINSPEDAVRWHENNRSKGEVK